MPITREFGTCWEVSGSGPALVLVHGLGLNRQTWRWVRPSLEREFRVLTYDFPGHGQTPPRSAEQGLFLEDLIAQLEEVVEAAGFGTFLLAGFSLGGHVAQAFTLANPARINALAVLHSACGRTLQERSAIEQRMLAAIAGGPGPLVPTALQRWFTPAFGAAHPEVLEEVGGWVSATDPRSFSAAYGILCEADDRLTPRLGGIGCPALVVTGDEDHGNSPAMARRMADAIPGAECAILPGLRHMALAEDPGAVLDVLQPFLEAHSGRDTRPKRASATEIK